MKGTPARAAVHRDREADDGVDDGASDQRRETPPPLTAAPPRGTERAAVSL